MKVVVEPSGNAIVEFENEEELQSEYERNISKGGMSFTTEEAFDEFAQIRLTLKLSGGGKISVPAIVVRLWEGAVAVAIEESPEKILSSLKAAPEETAKPDEVAGIALPDELPDEDDSPDKEQSAWDRMRSLTRNEKVMLAPKAGRNERAILLQESDMQIIFYLLKNPRIGTEEVARIARSPYISSAIADQIARTTQWASNLEIKVALVNNPRTPTPLALRLLPTLPESEIRQIAKGSAVSQALKQAALRIVINKQ